MIPKTIHYCWLSGDPYPRKIRKCIDSWRRVMPDYEIKLWNTANFDIDSAPEYVRQAFLKRKWAFAADYIRLHALYTDGGIYLDSDVMALKPFDPLLNHSFMTSLEYHPTQAERDKAYDMIDGAGKRTADGFVSGIQLQAAVMGAEKGSPFLLDVMRWYDGKQFIDSEGNLATTVLAPQIYARVAEDYGFRYLDKDQSLKDGVMVYRSEIFAGNRHEVTPESYAIHYCAHSWHPGPIEKLRKLLGLKP